MKNFMLYSYILNLVFLIMHEIDGAYWKEWKFFGSFGESLTDRKGLSIYLYAHIPIFLILLYGLVSLDNYFGLIVSAIFSGFMIFHFFIHNSHKIMIYGRLNMRQRTGKGLNRLPYSRYIRMYNILSIQAAL